MPEQSKRLDYLDVLRGIAAFLVVVYHFIGGRLNKTDVFYYSSIVFNGSDAVSFFFVLSGLVLSYKYFQRGHEINLPAYTFKRFFRLYPPFLVTVLIYFLMENGITWDLGNLKAIFWDNKDFIQHELLMVRGHHNEYYLPGWTLGVEMALSLLVPIVVMAVQRSGGKTLWWLLAVVIFVGPLFLSEFMFHFVLGMILAYYFKWIRDFDWKNSKLYPWRYFIFLAIFSLFSLRHFERLSPFGPTYYHVASLLEITIFHYTGLAAFLMIGFVIQSKRAQELLVNKPLLFLGKISFGIYLTHWEVVAKLNENWDTISGWTDVGMFGNYCIWITVAMAITIVLSTIMYYLLEKPVIKWANRVAKKRFG